MGWIASILGFGVSVAAAIVIYVYAFDSTVWMIEKFTGPTDATTKWIIAFILIFVFVSIGTKVGRFARDWIEAGPRGGRQAAR
jgi:hypothetical protein